MQDSVNTPNLKSSLQDYADLIKHGIDGNPDIYKPTWKDEALTYKMRLHIYHILMQPILIMLRS